MTMCMGLPRIGKLCNTCRRLPRDPEGEDSPDWVTPGYPCKDYKPVIQITRHRRTKAEIESEKRKEA